MSREGQIAIGLKPCSGQRSWSAGLCVAGQLASQASLRWMPSAGLHPPQDRHPLQFLTPAQLHDAQWSRWIHSHVQKHVLAKCTTLNRALGSFYRYHGFSKCTLKNCHGCQKFSRFDSTPHPIGPIIIIHATLPKFSAIVWDLGIPRKISSIVKRRKSKK